MTGPAGARVDAVVVGGGHNGLVAAAYLARAGRSVLLLECAPALGGAAVSAPAFRGVDARVSRYAYLVSLLPARIVEDLGLRFAVRSRRISSYTPVDDGGLLVDAGDRDRTRSSMRALTGGDAEHDAWEAWHAGTGRLARAVFPTLLEPLRDPHEIRRAVGDDAIWEAIVERPLGEALEARFADDVVRGVVLTDALIGTFASAHAPDLRQNRCLLYHVIGGGTGAWDVPVGGMGALTAELARVAAAAGADLRTEAAVTAIAVDESGGEVTWLDAAGTEHRVAADVVLGAVAPAVLDRLLAAADCPVRVAAGDPRPEGSQLKVNLLLRRLPRLRDTSIAPAEAFAGTFHVGERASALAAAHRQADAGEVPARPPSELYCHTLTDRSILGPELAASGAHTLTLFGLHLPARLFHHAGLHELKETVVARTLDELDRHLDEPIGACLHHDADGRPCIEARTPLELQHELGLPGGHIFHRDLRWPWAHDDVPAGAWGVETDVPSLLVCGAGAIRGGGVSGVPGHNAAMAVLGRS